MMTKLSSGEQIRLRRALEAVCQHVELDPAGAELIKYTMNAVYQLDDPGVIVRIAMGAGAAARVDRVVQVATTLTELGVPTVTLADGFERAIHVEGWSASIWTLMPQPSKRVWRPIDLIRPLQAIHAIDRTSFPLASWDPVAKSRQRLAAMDGLAEDDRYLRELSTQVGRPLNDILDGLRQCCDELAEAVKRIEWNLPTGVIHGDAHTGNLLVAPDGRIVFCDLDSVAVGPREWDLTPAAHGMARFGRDPAAYADFARNYGFDITRWCGWDTLRQVRDLQLVTSVIGSLAGRPAVADELAHRLRSFFAGDWTATWHRYR